MKKIFILFGLITILFSCKTTECYYVDGTETIVINDTLEFESFHRHIEDDSCNHYCFYIEESKFIYTDTIEVEVIKCKKVIKRK